MFLFAGRNSCVLTRVRRTLRTGKNVPTLVYVCAHGRVCFAEKRGLDRVAFGAMVGGCGWPSWWQTKA